MAPIKMLGREYRFAPTQQKIDKRRRKPCTDVHVKFHKFSGGIIPRFPHWGWRALPRPFPLGAPALCASTPRLGPSAVNLSPRNKIIIGIEGLKSLAAAAADGMMMMMMTVT